LGALTPRLVAGKSSAYPPIQYADLLIGSVNGLQGESAGIATGPTGDSSQDIPVPIWPTIAPPLQSKATSDVQPIALSPTLTKLALAVLEPAGRV